MLIVPESILKQFCIPENRVRKTYYSDTYRAEFSVGKQTGLWDITHISIPFCASKEEYLKEYYGLNDNELTLYYEKFSAHLTNSINLIAEIHNMGNSNLSVNFVQYVYKDIIPKPDRGSDIYLVSEPIDPLIESEFFVNDSVTLQNLLSLCARITQTLRLLDGTGIHIGATDLHSLGLAMSGEKPIVKFTSLLYGHKEGQEFYSLLPTTPPTYANVIHNGFAPSMYTDLVSVAILLWRLGGGTSEDISTMPVERPQYLPDSIVTALKTITSKEPTNASLLIKDTHKKIYNEIRRLGTKPDENIIIPLYFTEPPPSENEQEVIPQASEPQYDFGLQEKESLPPPPRREQNEMSPSKHKVDSESRADDEGEDRNDSEPPPKAKQKPHQPNNSGSSKSSGTNKQSGKTPSKSQPSSKASGTQPSKAGNPQPNKSSKSQQSGSKSSSQKSGASKPKSETNASAKKSPSQSSEKSAKKNEPEKEPVESGSSKKGMALVIIVEFLILTGTYVGLMYALPEQMIAFIQMLQNLF